MIQVAEMANIPILEKVVNKMKQRDQEGKTLSYNSLSVLLDNDIVDKALEFGINLASFSL
jgi:hypothetical protein